MECEKREGSAKQREALGGNDERENMVKRRMQKRMRKEMKQNGKDVRI